MNNEMSKLARLHLELEKAKQAYFGARDRYDAELVRTYKFQVGDVIRSTDGQLAKVTGAFVRSEKVIVTAIRQLNDGRFGKAVVPFWREEWQDAIVYERQAPT